MRVEDFNPAQMIHKLKRNTRLGVVLCLGFFLAFVMAFQSCKEDPQLLGRDLLPDDDDFIVRSDTQFIIDAYTEKSPPILSANKPIGILGSYYDDQFGRSKAGILTQLGLAYEGEFDFGANPVLDSLVLYLLYDDIFGDTLAEHTVRLYELTEDLQDSIYYSDFDPSGLYDPVELGSNIISARDSLTRIRISRADFLDRFISGEDSIYDDPLDFKDYIKGFYINTDTIDTGGALYYIKFGDPGLGSYLQLFYRNDSTDSLAVVYQMSTTEINVNPFRHSFSGSAVANFLSDEPTTDSVLFVQTMGGARMRFRFPELQAWLDSMPIAINSAQLLVYTEDSTLSGISPDQYPVKLFIRFMEESGSEQQLLDYVIEGDNSNLVDGNYDKENNRYRFNIGYHLQNYLNGTVPFPELIMVPANANISANRVVLKSPFYDSGERMQLKIVYTKL